MTQHEVHADPRGRLVHGLAVTQRALTIHGTTAAMLVGGQGPPMVLLHGGVQAGGVVWWRVLDRLVERHRVVVPDLPGLGESAPLARLDADSTSRWLADLVRQTCTEPATLVAHSAPGGLAARFAIQHGDLLRQLVLVDAAGLGSFRPSPPFLVALLRANLRPSRPNVERFLRGVVVDLDRTCDETGDAWESFVAYLTARSASSAAKQAMRQLVQAGTKRVPDAALQRIGVPTALLWGREDPLIPATIAEAASARLGWPLTIVEQAGHLPHVEQPDAFVDAVRVFTDGP